LKHLRILEWDSQCFGYKIGEITTSNIKQALSEARQENFRLLYAKIYPQDALTNNLAQHYGGILIDEKITFLASVPTYLPESKAIWYPEHTLTPQLIGLALQSGAFSRFKRDENFCNREFEKLYTIWIEKSVKREIAEEIAIFTEKEDILGLLTLFSNENRACVGLMAVAEPYRGKEIGKNLIFKAFEFAKNKQKDFVQIVTQKANHQACAFYEKMGFKIEKIENIYHFWL